MGQQAMSNTDLVTPNAAQAIRPPVQWRNIVAFSALAYALSGGWWAPMVWPYLSRITLTGPLPNVVEGGSVRVPLGMFGPLVAALIMRLFVTREWLNGTLGVIRPWRYYAVALLAPALFVASIICVDHVSGLGQFAPARPLGLAIPIVLFVGGALGVPLTLGEEYGWRGYLLPRVLPLGELRATFIVAMIWALWHVPILLIGLNYPNQTLSTVLPVFALAVVLTAFPFTWLYVDSRSSVMVVAVMHAVLNATGDTFTSSKYLQGNPLMVSAGGLVAAAILLVLVVAYGVHRYAGTGRESIRV
jgi:hypothetical protein